MCCGDSVALAGEKIEGAFGFKLGDVFDLSKAIKTNRVMCWVSVGENKRVGTLKEVYDIADTNRPSVFQTFFAEITPKSHRVYRTTAQGGELSKEDSEELLRALRDKYETQKGSSDGLGKLIDQGNRYIERRIDVDNRYVDRPNIITASLCYTDVELMRLADREAAQKKFEGKPGL